MTLRLLALALSVSTLLPASLQAGPVPKRIETLIKSKIVPAYRQEDSASIERILSNWLTKFNDEELDKIDELLDSHGVPPTGRLILDVRVTQLLAGNNPANGKVPPRELTRSMPVLFDRVNEEVERITESEFFEEKLPDYSGMQDYHDAFWEIHVAKNKLRTAKRSTRYGQAFLDAATATKLRGLTKAEQESLEIDFTAQEKAVDEAIDRLDEAKTEMQIAALSKAAKVVRESDDYKERLRAAYVIEFSSDPIIETLKKKSPNEYERPLLQDEQLLSTVESSVRYARESAGDLAEQARLLYLGMHWWMRGRYGAGPDGMGLLKSVHALRSDEAQFPLYMPTKPPQPTEPSASSYGYGVPQYDRRHHYIWMYEYRTMLSKNVFTEETTYEPKSKTKLDQFY